jgi:type I restriction enzyme R subunit
VNGTLAPHELPEEMVSFARSHNEEEQHGIPENLSEEELATFDLPIRPNIKLTQKESVKMLYCQRLSSRL